MKIMMSNRDDILRRRQEWDDDYNARRKRYDDQYANWDKALYAVTDPVKNYLENQLSRFSNLDFEVSVDFAFYSNPGLDVRISCNEQKMRMNDEDSALSWSYRAKLNQDGEITRETSSWSGLNAVTSAQMDSLRSTVDAIEYLNNIDWKDILDKKAPKFSDYVTEPYPHKNSRPDFEKELLDDEIESLIGKNIAIESKDGSDYYFIVKENPNFYYVRIVPDWPIKTIDETESRNYIDQVLEELSTGKFASRIKKSNFLNMIKQPLVKVEV